MVWVSKNLKIQRVADVIIYLSYLLLEVKIKDFNIQQEFLLDGLKAQPYLLLS